MGHLLALLLTCVCTYVPWESGQVHQACILPSLCLPFPCVKLWFKQPYCSCTWQGVWPCSPPTLTHWHCYISGKPKSSPIKVLCSRAVPNLQQQRLHYCVLSPFQVTTTDKDTNKLVPIQHLSQSLNSLKEKLPRSVRKDVAILSTEKIFPMLCVSSVRIYILCSVRQ